MTVSFVILEAISKLQKEYSHLYSYDGFGYCGFMSTKLKEYLKLQGIEVKLIAGKNVKNTPEGIEALEAAKRHVNSIAADSGKEYIDLKVFFDKNPGKLKTNLGHMVTVYKGNCYDPTSKQFDFPMYYSLEFFCKVFNDISVGRIVTGDPSVNFGVDEAKFNRVKYSDVSLETSAPYISRW